VKIERCAVELLRIIDFQNGDRPPSWIWYDVIVDHPRLAFDGLNVLLKLHVYRVNILRVIAVFTRAGIICYGNVAAWLAGWVDYYYYYYYYKCKD